jgi:hypothetical protein
VAILEGGLEWGGDDIRGRDDARGCVCAMCAKLILRCMCLLEGKRWDVFHACVALLRDK